MEPEHFSSFMSGQMIAFAFSLAGCALFSFLETSVTALRLFKLKEIASSTHRYKLLLETLEHNPHQVLITILIANSLMNVTAAALITNIMEQLFAFLHLSTGLGFSLGIGIGTALMLIVGEVIPKNLAKVQGERLFKSVLWITNITFYLLYPFVQLLISCSNFFVGRLAGQQQELTETVTSEREIRFLIDYISKKGLIETEKTEMLQSIFNFGSKPVREIMVPAVDIVTINATASVNDALAMFSKYQFSRLPVYEENTDNIIGMLYQKDLFLLLSQQAAEKPLNQLVRPILFVPESMKINQLLRKFRTQRMHIAMVINEYGSITGLVTLEDILEEIVGEISDEYEEVTDKIIPLKEGGWLVDATVDLDDLSELLHITLCVEDAITLGGFLTEQLQHLPNPGEKVLYEGYYFVVLKASHKRVLQVLIHHKDSPEPAGYLKQDF